ncbi:MAG: fluoride efflux transporter CrcB [Gammaproteobacteria bacterium]|jgi:CrcB protein|nr:fluoride efflux transporter CrcB [Gammaproteobacteria bacterium]
MERNVLLQFLYVGVGGFFGAGLRFALSSWLSRALPHALFPYGTMAVNVIGCLLIGFLAAYRQPLDPGLRLFLMVGLLGGFTTFSTFALETLSLAQQNQAALAFLNVAVKVCLGLAAAWAGFELGRALSA